MLWYNTNSNITDKWRYEKLLQTMAQSICDELLRLYLSKTPTDKTFNELFTQCLPPHYSQHHADVYRLCSRLLMDQGYYISAEPGKILENAVEYDQQQYRAWHVSPDRDRLLPMAQTITQTILAQYQQGAARDADFIQLVHPHAADVTAEEYIFLTENIIDNICAAGYTIHTFDPFQISLTFNTHKPPRPIPCPHPKTAKKGLR